MMKPAKAKNIDLMDLFSKPNKQDDRFFNKQMVSIHEFYLCGEIESADEYIAWFDTIRHAGDNDVIKIYINSYGGDVFTAIQFMRALNETRAAVVMSVEGACMSAATMIFLSGHSFQVSEHSAIMIHTYSGGTIGKGNEMYAQSLFERGWSLDLIKNVYAGFLTEAEIEHVIAGGDIWLTSVETSTRLQALVEHRKAQEDTDTDDNDQPIVE